MSERKNIRKYSRKDLLEMLIEQGEILDDTRAELELVRKAGFDKEEMTDSPLERMKILQARFALLAAQTDSLFESMILSMEKNKESENLLTRCITLCRWQLEKAGIDTAEFDAEIQKLQENKGV